MYVPIFTPLIEAIRVLGGKYLEKQYIIADGKVTVAKAKAEAEAIVQVKKATAEIEWEATMAQGSLTSWKDEAWTIFFIAVLGAAFIPPLEPFIQSGFSVIGTLPDWFGTAVLLAIGAAFGKNIVKEVNTLKNTPAQSTYTTREIK
jgi:hypothetical protein